MADKQVEITAWVFRLKLDKLIRHIKECQAFETGHA